MSEIITLDRHIRETERNFPMATGRFTGLLQHIAVAAKVVTRVVRRAGLVDILGSVGESNVQGEDVQKLDRLAHNTLVNFMRESDYLAVMASEEDEDVIPVPQDGFRGRYVVNFDPLDGSSNIDSNVSVGTIFSILPRITKEGESPEEMDCAQPGRNQLAAGYILYGSSTMFVYSTGAGVHGFTLDPTIGEFLLSHPDMHIPHQGRIYSVNTGNRAFWSEGVRRFIEDLETFDPGRGLPYTARYIGSLVSDFHRNLLHGGIFLYPADRRSDPAKPKPKLRLLYEANPLAYLVEQAGGRASDGRRRILDIMPRWIHERVELFIGSAQDVINLEASIAKYDR